MTTSNDPEIVGELSDPSGFAQSPGHIEFRPAPPVRIPREVAESLAEKPKEGSFDGKGMTGGEIFARLCKQEKLAAMFCAPGNYAVTHAIAAEGISSYGGRTEGGMCSAADGFYRASREVAACSGTEGPGLAHMIMGIAAASRARTPLLILASNANMVFEDREMLFQNMYQQPLTEGIKKYGKRIVAPDRIYEYGAYAFRHLKTGVPGPVHLDFPYEVTDAHFTSAAQLTDYWDRSRYRTESVAAPSPRDMREVVRLLDSAKRPLLIAGHGVFHRDASRALQVAAERNEFAVVVSGPMRGQFPDDHRLSMNLSPTKLPSADVVVFVGQYCMPSPTEYKINPNATTIRVHPVVEDLGRNWPLDLGIVADERAFLEMLADALPIRRRPDWVSEVQASRKEYEEELDAH
jgi:acetolactate synthase-1/2/3 large subunit